MQVNRITEILLREFACLTSSFIFCQQDCKYSKQELQKLRRENGSLDSERHEHSKTLSQLNTKVAVMEQEIRDKEQVNSFVVL